MHTISARPILTNEERSHGQYSSEVLSHGCSVTVPVRMDAPSMLPVSQILPPLALETASRLVTTSRTKLAFVDLDHTVSDAFWRDFLLKPNLSEMTEADWREYHLNAVMDNPIKPVRDLVRALFAYDYEIIILTSRPEYVRPNTIHWLEKNAVPYHTLVMRPTDNHQSASYLKVAQARSYIDETKGDKQVIILDDNEAVCEAFCKAGAAVLRAQINRRPNCRKFTGQG